jgi:tRNA G18 (ribose-2'-O)-methylase SpoU
MYKQKTHSEFSRDEHGLDITILCDDVKSPANIGGVLRLADAYGVNQIVFISDEKEKLSPKVKSVSRGAQNYLNYSFSKDYNILELDPERLWICLEITDTSIPVTELVSIPSKIGIIIGNENRGVNSELLERFASYHLKMYGNNSSMNVTNSLSAILFYLTQLIK